jgi:hypothetical protein
VIQGVHGVHLISINANGFHKSLKNEHSAREIPTCPKLIQLGFLDFVEERRQSDGKCFQHTLAFSLGLGS